MSEQKRHSTGLIFVACMFIGAGIGMIFDAVAVGGAIGMGVGFLLMALLRPNIEPLHIKFPATFFGIILLLAGFFLVGCGIALLFFPELIYPYLTGIFIIFLGVCFIVWAIWALSKRENQ